MVTPPPYQFWKEYLFIWQSDSLFPNTPLQNTAGPFRLLLAEPSDSPFWQFFLTFKIKVTTQTSETCMGVLYGLSTGYLCQCFGSNPFYWCVFCYFFLFFYQKKANLTHILIKKNNKYGSFTHEHATVNAIT